MPNYLTPDPVTMAWANAEALGIERDDVAAQVDELRSVREADEQKHAAWVANQLPSARNGRGVIQLSNADDDVDPAMEAEISDLIAQDEDYYGWMAAQLPSAKVKSGR